jgi:hypothetical protein
MITEGHAQILKMLHDGLLADGVDDNSPEFNMDQFEELLSAGMAEAKNASADTGRSYLCPKITFKGRRALIGYHEQKKGWWQKLTGWKQVLGVFGVLASLAVAVVTIWEAVK